MTKTFHSSSFFYSINRIISGGRYNLCSYTIHSFLQVPITFSHKSLSTDQHCSQTQSTVYSQCHGPSVTPTFMKILWKHKHIHNVYISDRHIFSMQEGEQNIMQLLWSLQLINFLSIFWFCYLYSLTPRHNNSSSTPFQN